MVYNVGIIGCGVIGKRLAHYFNANPLTEVKSVCDLDENLAKKLSTQYDANWSLDYKELLQDSDIDIIYVGIPPEAHYSVIIDSLQAEKHVISEKPLSLNYDLCKELIMEKNKYPELLTTVNLPFRFSSPALKLKAELELNKIGKVQSIEFNLAYPQWPRAWQNVNWLKTRKQGGPLREVGTHFFFLLCELYGMPQSVTSIVMYPDETSCETSAKGIIKIKDSLECKVELDLGKSKEDVNDLIFHGSGGTLAFKDWHELLFIDNKGKIAEYSYEKQLTLDDMISEFTRVLNTNNDDFSIVGHNLVTFEDAAQAQLILDAIYNSNGKEIIL